MKTIVALLALVAVALARPDGTYNPQYDDFNSQELVQNIRLLKNFGHCFLDKGPCTPEGADFKKIIPEALKTKCGKCTKKQEGHIRLICTEFKKQLPELWAELLKKHDPEGEYKEAFEAFLKASE